MGISLNSGEIKLIFQNIDNYKKYIKEFTNIEFNYIYDILSKPGILSKTGINYYIYEKDVEVKKSTFEKKEFFDNFILLCNNIDDNIFKKDNDRDNIIILKDKKIYYPKFLKRKKNDKINANLKKIFKINDSIIKKSNKFNDLTCNVNLKNDETNKNIVFRCRYIIINNDILLPTFPSGTLHDVKTELSIDKYLKNIQDTISDLLLINNEINLNLIPIGFLYSNVDNDKFNFLAFLFDNEIELRVKSELISESKIKDISKKFNKSIFIKKSISEEEIINKFIMNNEFQIDDRIKNIKKKLFDNESYELFRLEFSNFLNHNNSIKEKISKIIESNKFSKNDKKKLIQKIIYKNISKNIYDALQTGGNNKFINVNDNKIDLNNYKINNKRLLCSIYENKDDCNSNYHCKFISNKCLFNISTKKTINFVSKIIDELLSDQMKSKELLKEDNYFISDIVDL